MKFFLIIFVLLVGSIIYAGNTFWTNHQFTIQAVAAFGTLAAVVLSLWLANRKYQPKNISVKAKIENKPPKPDEIFYPANEDIKAVSLQVSNFETFSATIDSGFLRIFGEVFHTIDAHRNQNESPKIPNNLLKEFPVSINQGEIENFWVEELEPFKKLLAKRYKQMDWFSRLSLKLSLHHFCNISVIISKNFELKVILSAELKKEVKEAIRMGVK